MSLVLLLGSAASPQLVTPGTRSLTLATFAPTVTASDNKTATVGLATLSTASFAPTATVSNHQLVTAGVASLSTTKFAPTVTASDHQLVTPGVRTLTTTGLAPAVNLGIIPPTASLTLTAFAPTVTASDHKTVTPGVASLVVAGTTPEVWGGQVGDLALAGTYTFSAVSVARLVARGNSSELGFAAHLLSEATGHFTLVLQRVDNANESSLTLATVDLGPHPAASQWNLRALIYGDPTAVTMQAKAWIVGDPEPAWTAVTDNYPLITRNDSWLSEFSLGVITQDSASAGRLLAIYSGVASLTTTGLAPTVTASDHQTATPGTASLTTTGLAPTVTASDHQRAVPDATSLTLTPFAPTVAATAHVTATPDTAALSTSAFAPSVAATAHQTVTPATAALTLTGEQPSVTVGDNVEVQPAMALLALTGLAPTVTATQATSDVFSGGKRRRQPFIPRPVPATPAPARDEAEDIFTLLF